MIKINLSAILAGGIGKRFNSSTPKQYMQLCGEDVIFYAIRALKQSSKSDQLVVVANDPYREYLRKKYNVRCVEGGQTHNRSVKNLLDYVKVNYPDCEKILFADSVRPLITSKLADLYFDLLDSYEAVITAPEITDSLGKVGEQFVDRTDYFLIQKPEAFQFEKLYRCFCGDSEMTAIVQQMPRDTNIKRYDQFPINLKITYPHDLMLAELLLQRRIGSEAN